MKNEELRRVDEGFARIMKNEKCHPDGNFSFPERSEGILHSSLKEGLFWGGISNGIQQLLNLLFGIFLARLLSPADYGMVGMLAIFPALASILQEGGFISALTNRKEILHRDYNAVFWFSLLMGLGLYALLFLCAPFIAHFFHQPELTPLARLSFLSFLVSSLNVAPRALLFKQLRTKENAIISLSSLTFSGVVGIILAYNGFAYWGIAVQTIAFTAGMTLLSYRFSGWRPSMQIDFTPIREMIGYSSRLIVTHAFQVINNNLFAILLGKFYTEKEVGYFNQAAKWSTMGYTTINGMVTGVAQPVLTTLTEDKERQLNVLRKMVRFTAFLSFPVLLGLSFTANELIILAVTEKWLPSASSLQLLCIGGAFLPICSLFSQLILSRGHSSVYMWNTIALCLLQLASACLLYPYGLRSMLFAFVCIQIAWMFVWLCFVWREVRLTLALLLKDMLPYLLLSVVLIALVSLIAERIDHVLLRLLCKVGLVGSLYCFILWRLKSAIFQEAMKFIFRKRRKA